MSNLPPVSQRHVRVAKAIALEQPDRVPFVPMLNNVFALGYDVTIYQAMTDPTSANDAVRSFLKRYDPDIATLLGFYSIPALEAAGAADSRWPGETHKLPPNTPFQYIDKSYIESDEDYDAFILDPSLYLLTRVLPRKYKALSGLALLNPYSLCSPSPFGLVGAALPPLKAALEALVNVGEITMGHIGATIPLQMEVMGMGYPTLGNAVTLNPFDEFADSVRGLIPTVTDLVEDPERVAAAVERWAQVSIPAGIAQAKMLHAQYVFIPLHCGVDEFMSPANYSKYYWPPLKKLITAIIDAGMTPFIVTEGNYHTRLEQLCDVPRGKVIYSFEKVDMKRAKAVLGGVACVAGNFPTANLISGTVEQVEDITKKLIDDCAPGGGYMMSNSIALDNVDHRLLEAWRDTTYTYGTY